MEVCAAGGGAVRQFFVIAVERLEADRALILIHYHPTAWLKDVAEVL
jgi:hypothetical protein